MREYETNLIQNMASGDPAAGREFVDRWDNTIKGWIVGRAPREKVEEYAQEVWAHLIAGNWLRLLQWKPLYDPDAWHEESLRAYLKQITIHKVSDLRDREPPQLPSGLDPSDIIDGTLGSDPLVAAERSRLMRAFESCTRWFRKSDHRAILLWWEGHTAQHIAELLETNANNVYQRRSHLLKQLRDCLVENLPEYFRHV